MIYKQHIPTLIIGSLLATGGALFLYSPQVAGAVHNFIWIYSSSASRLLFVVTLVLYLLALSPSIFFMRWKKLPHYFLITMFAMILFIAVLMATIGPMPSFLQGNVLLKFIYYEAYLLSFYVLGDLLLNRWNVRFRYRLFVAFGIICLVGIYGMLR